MAWTKLQTTCDRAGPHSAADADCAARVTAAALHERYLEDVFRYVLRRVPNISEAEDITAEVFAAAATSLSRFHGQCSPYLWLLGIARRKIADALRRRASRREVLHSEMVDGVPGSDPLWETLLTVEGPEAALVRAEARRVVEDLVAELSPDQREAVLLQYMERLSMAEIAVVMDRSLASVKGLLQRARATLYRRGREYFEE